MEGANAEMKWTLQEFQETWDDFKKLIKQKGYKQKRMINSTQFSSMLYYCNLNNDCSSQYEVNKYDEYYDVSFNILEHLENCQTELNKEERIRDMIKAKAKPINITKTLKLEQDKKKLKSL